MMNKIMRGVTMTVFAMGLGYSAVAFAADEFITAKDHVTSAGLYEKEANAQNSLINQHERMVDSNFIRQNSSASAQNEMRKHCSEIVAKAKALQTELLSAAAWHKKQ